MAYARADLPTRSTKAFKMHSTKARFLSSDSTALLWAVVPSVIVVIVMGFILSAPSLISLAVRSNISPDVAWAWFIAVDGTIIVATFSILLLRKRKHFAVRAYPALVLVIFGSLSVWADGVHGNGRDLTAIETFIVGAVAPIALLATTHLLVLILTSPEESLSEVELVRIQKRLERESAPSIPAIAASPRARASIAAAPSQKSVDRDTAVSQILTWHTENGSWPTGSQVGQWLGKSQKTGMRLLVTVRETTS